MKVYLNGHSINKIDKFFMITFLENILNNYIGYTYSPWNNKILSNFYPVCLLRISQYLPS
jgi:hypothetical protein